MSKKGGDAPDPNPGMLRSAEAIEKVGMSQVALQKEYMEWAKGFYDEMKPLVTAQQEQELEISRTNKTRGDEYAQMEKGYYRPMEKRLVNEADAYDTDAKREQLATQASGDVSQAFGVARAQSNREMWSHGINPNAGRFAALNNQLTLQEALNKAGVQTKARTDAENLGFARRSDVVGLGRNLVANAATTYGVSLGASNQAGNTSMRGGNFMNSAYGQGSNMLGQAGQTYGTAGNIYGQEFNARMQGYTADQQSANAGWSGIGSMVGRLGAAYMTGGTSMLAGAVPGRADGGKVRGLRMANGGVHEGAGPVSGPGGPVDDKVPAMLSDGEYVLPADTVKKLGVKKLDKLVKKTHTPAAIQRKRSAKKGIK